ncbi:MAG: peptide deformylase [Rickettsiales bacterium]
MAVLNFIIAPHPIFKQKATPVAEVNDNVRSIANDMLDTIYHEGAIGIGSNMVGVTHKIAVIDLRENNTKTPLVLINPEITKYSQETESADEGSFSFPGIIVSVPRATEVTVTFLDLEGKQQTLTAQGFLARVIQHEVDYLYGKTFLDYTSKLKQNMLISKMLKYIKNNPPHVHGAHCNH